MSKYFDFSDEADHAAFVEDLSKEIVGRPLGGGGGGGGLAPGVLALIDAAAAPAKEGAKWARIANFKRFLAFYRDHVEGCRTFYTTVSAQVAELISMIKATVRDSEGRVANLGVQKEQNKDKAAEQAELQKENVRLKKEVEELDAVIEQHLKTVLDDKLTIARSKLAVGQEMAINYNLYQNLMSELQVALLDEPSVEMYASYAGKEDSGVAKFQAKLQEIFEVETTTDEEAMEWEAKAPEMAKRLARTMSVLREDKIHEINERAEELLVLRY